MSYILKLGRCLALFAVVGHGIAIAQPVSDEQAGTSATEKLGEAAMYQILLGQANFSPGSIDGKWGEGSSRSVRALKAFQKANGMEVSGKPGEEITGALEKAAHAQGRKNLLTTYTITEEDAKGPFVDEIPDDWKKLSEMDRLSYTALEEMLGEKFHSDPAFLKQLNSSELKAGQEIIVPDVKRFEVPSSEDNEGFYSDTKASNVVVSGEDKSLTVKGPDGKILYYAPITPGSESLPLPSETLEINALDVMPKYYFDPEVIKEADAKEKLELPPGPNSPVGIVWIDLSKDGYGIHGTSAPEKIGYSTSHGCVRLTNWDAAAVAKLVKKGMSVEFSAQEN
jgi:lipoprotein-anchoring transpeptidase ErfK/SrfK